ncbi:hypothetical protein QTL95_21835 [Rhizobium sp. S152]|uniref:hypothetical protein n=1 Tax=Rhizobium sp. S152 TaxID=3055038 RepID=UPI0025A9C1AE|nr:hypothetical protein [Rhizobium sp. S152]MDM9628543.1 hypothetical protein [Rhizobium sp. S152]
MMTARTLNEMTRHERSNMISWVAQTLDDLAEDAEDQGDRVSAENANYLARTLRGCGIHAADLKATELLLEQGISYVVALSDRYGQYAVTTHPSDDDDEVLGTEVRVLH